MRCEGGEAQTGNRGPATPPREEPGEARGAAALARVAPAAPSQASAGFLPAPQRALLRGSWGCLLPAHTFPHTHPTAGGGTHSIKALRQTRDPLPAPGPPFLWTTAGAILINRGAFPSALPSTPTLPFRTHCLTLLQEGSPARPCPRGLTFCQCGLQS